MAAACRNAKLWVLPESRRWSLRIRSGTRRRRVPGRTPREAVQHFLPPAESRAPSKRLGPVSVPLVYAISAGPEFQQRGGRNYLGLPALSRCGSVGVAVHHGSAELTCMISGRARRPCLRKQPASGCGELSSRHDLHLFQPYALSITSNRYVFGNMPCTRSDPGPSAPTSTSSPVWLSFTRTAGRKSPPFLPPITRRS